MGRVSFEGRDTRAEADRASFRRHPGRGRESSLLELFAEERSKARLAYGRTRVAGGTDLHRHAGTAPGGGDTRRGEPASRQDGRRRSARGSFVRGGRRDPLRRRPAREPGGRPVLHFNGSVRGWQGERNLAAETELLLNPATTNGIEAHREVVDEVSPARGGGQRRFPRAISCRSAPTISSSTTRRGSRSTTGNVSVRLSEGWLEAERLEVGPRRRNAADVRQVRATETVRRLEFHRSSSGELEAPVTGEADRAVYDPSRNMTVFWLYGDQSPASVVRACGERWRNDRPDGVLAYRLDLGHAGPWTRVGRDRRAFRPAVATEGASLQGSGKVIPTPRYRSGRSRSEPRASAGQGGAGTSRRETWRSNSAGAGSWTDVSVRIAPGEVVGLLGPNGAGKTTSFYLILGLIPSDGGRVLLDGRDITALPMYLRAREGIGLPAAGGVDLPSHVGRRRTCLSILEMRGLDGVEAKTTMRSATATNSDSIASHARRATRCPAESAGEPRSPVRLASEPRYMLLDEPFAGIDPIAVSELQRVVVRLKEKRDRRPDHRSQRP